MMKNSMDQNGATGIIDMPSGYATNARPGPASQLINTAISKSNG